jgi:hypothetical protein
MNWVSSCMKKLEKDNILISESEGYGKKCVKAEGKK